MEFDVALLIVQKVVDFAHSLLDTLFWGHLGLVQRDKRLYLAIWLYFELDVGPDVLGNLGEVSGDVNSIEFVVDQFLYVLVVILFVCYDPFYFLVEVLVSVDFLEEEVEVRRAAVQFFEENLELILDSLFIRQQVV